MKRTLVLVGVAIALVGCSKPVATPNTQTTPDVTTSSDATVGDAPVIGVSDISIKGFAFAPQSITVKAGSAVTWTNNDSFAHTVTSAAGSPASFDSASLGAGKSFSFTFDTPGTYSYVCDFHGQMTGTIIIQ